MTSLPDPSVIMARHQTISARIRALAEAGYSRSQIAGLVERSYQQVRQVLVDEERRRASRAPSHPTGPGMLQETAPFQAARPGFEPVSERLVIDHGGRLTLPASLLKALGVHPGEVFLAIGEAEGTVLLMNSKKALEQAQALVRRFVPPGVSLVDELLAERRAEAARDNRDD